MDSATLSAKSRETMQQVLDGPNYITIVTDAITAEPRYRAVLRPMWRSRAIR